EVLPFEISVIGLYAVGIVFYQALLAVSTKLDLQSRRRVARNFVLDGKDIDRRAITVVAGPKHPPVAGIDEPRVDPHSIAVFDHAAFEDCGNPQLFPGLARINFLALEKKRR